MIRLLAIVLVAIFAAWAAAIAVLAAAGIVLHGGAR
jgi:hypothetical protein